MLNITAIGEICAFYRGAKDKRAQVDILAQLYAVSAAEIRHILADNGYVLPDGTLPPKKATQAPVLSGKPRIQVGREELEQLAGDGLTIREIAERIGVTYSTVSGRLKAWDIPVRDGRRKSPAPELPVEPPKDTPAPELPVEPPKDTPPPELPVEQPKDTPATLPKEVPCNGRASPHSSLPDPADWRALMQALGIVDSLAKSARGAVIEGNLGMAGVRAERLCSEVGKLFSLAQRLRPPEDND